jgi:hypothetical protein
MRIALVNVDTEGLFPDPEDYLSRCGLEDLLTGHALTRFTLKAPLSAQTVAALNAHDLILLYGKHLLGGPSTGARRLRLEDYEAMRPPVVPLGVQIPRFEGEEEPHRHEAIRILRHWIRSSGPVSVADLPSHQFLSASLGPGSSVWTGPLALLAEEEPLRRARPRPIFVPPEPCGLSATQRAMVAELYQCLDEREPTLFLAQSPADYGLGARPGLGTLGCFRFPSLQKKALVSASSLLSSKVSPLLLALSHEVPAVLLATSNEDRAVASLLGVPRLDAADKARPEALADIFLQTLSHYPWEETRAALAERRRALLDHLAGFGLGASQSTAPQRPVLAPFIACCICDESHFPFTVGLIENLREVHEGPLRVHVLALDAKARELCESRFRQPDVTVHSLADLWSPEELLRVVDRPVALQAYSSKSRLLSKVLEEERRPVFYFDSDIYFFRSPVFLIKELGSHSVLLFPQWNRSLGSSRLHGLFNAGMIGVTEGAQSFLKLWSELCLYECAYREKSGYYVDQGFLDLMPLYFEETAIFRGLNQNVAPWNIDSLGVRLPKWDPLVPRLKSGLELSSYHAAFPDPQGLFELKFCWDQLVTFFSAEPRPASRQLAENTLHQQSPHWLSLSRFLYAYSHTGILRALYPSGIASAAKALEGFISGKGQWALGVLAFLHRSYRVVAGAQRRRLHPKRNESHPEIHNREGVEQKLDLA